MATDTPTVLLRVACTGRTFLDHDDANAAHADIDDYAHFDRPRFDADITDDLEKYTRFHSEGVEDQCEPVSSDGEGYGSCGYGSCEGSDSANDELMRGCDEDMGWNEEFKATYSDKKHSTATNKRHSPQSTRIGADVQAPAVVARGSPPTGFMCACCGKNRGFTLQTPWNVFCTAYKAVSYTHLTLPTNLRV